MVQVENQKVTMRGLSLCRFASQTSIVDAANTEVSNSASFDPKAKVHSFLSPPLMANSS